MPPHLHHSHFPSPTATMPRDQHTLNHTEGWGIRMAGSLDPRWGMTGDDLTRFVVPDHAVEVHLFFRENRRQHWGHDVFVRYQQTVRERADQDYRSYVTGLVAIADHPDVPPYIQVRARALSSSVTVSQFRQTVIDQELRRRTVRERRRAARAARAASSSVPAQGKFIQAQLSWHHSNTDVLTSRPGMLIENVGMDVDESMDDDASGQGEHVSCV